MAIITAAIPTEVWVSSFSALLGALGGIGGFITFWINRRKRKIRQRRNLEKSEHMGIVRFDIAKIKSLPYYPVPEPEVVDRSCEGSKQRSNSTNINNDTSSVQVDSREAFVKAVQDNIHGLESGIIVLTGPSDTGKETLLCHAVATCMPNVPVTRNGRRRLGLLWRHQKWPIYHDFCDIGFFRVENMSRNWADIRKDVVEWFRIRAEKQATGKRICIVYFDFQTGFSEGVIENVRKLYDEIMYASYDELARLKKFNVLFVVKITTAKEVLVSGAMPFRCCYHLTSLSPSQLLEVQKCFGSENSLMDGRWVHEITDGKIGRLIHYLRCDENANNEKLLIESKCRGWFRGSGSDRSYAVNINKSMALVYLLAAIRQHMDSQFELDVRKLVSYVIGLCDNSVAFDDYKEMLRNVFVLAHTDFSAVKCTDFQMDDQVFWNSFLASWGECGKYDFVDELHRIIRLLQANASFKSLMLPIALSVADALIESSRRTSAQKTTVIVSDRYATIMEQIGKIPGFRRVFRVAFARSLGGWLWRRIGTLENDDIGEVVTRIVATGGRENFDPSVLVEFMPVLVVVCWNPAKWFGGNGWWKKIARTCHTGDDAQIGYIDDEAETFLILVSYVWISFSKAARCMGHNGGFDELKDFVKTIRHKYYKSATEKTRMVVGMIWRVTSELFLLTKDCYFDKELAEKRYQTTVMRILNGKSFWWNTRFSHLVPALVRELKLDSFSSTSQNDFSKLKGFDFSVDGLTMTYKRCYVQTLAGMLNAYRNFYGITTNSNVKGLREQLRGRRRIGNALVPTASLDEPEKLRCVVWLQVNDFKNMFEKRGWGDEDRYRVVQNLLDDTLTWQKDLTDEYRAYCFMYLSRLCPFMSIKVIDAQLSSAYLFMEELSKWLGHVDSRTGRSVIDELTSSSGDLSTRCEYIIGSIPEIFVNVYRAFQDRECWRKWEKAFYGRKAEKFLRYDVIENVLFDSSIFVKGASRSSRIRLMQNLPFVTDVVNGRRIARRIAEVSLGKPLSGLSDCITDENYYARIFDSLGDLTKVEVSTEDLFFAIAALIYNASGSEKDIMTKIVYGWIRRLECIGKIDSHSKKAEWLYYALASNDDLREIDGYEDWRVSILKRIPSERILRTQYIEMAFELRNRSDVGESAVKDAILDVLHEDDLKQENKSFDDFEWRVRTLANTQEIWKACLSIEEQEKVRRLIFKAWGCDYRPADDEIYNFMQEIIQLNIAPWVECVKNVSEGVSPSVSFYPHVLLEGDMVDAAVSTDTHALLMNVLPDKDYDVGGSVKDECHGSITLVSERVISLGFVAMLQRIRGALQRLEPDSHVDIGIVANAKTLKNIESAILRLGIYGHGLHFLDYKFLHEQMEDILGSPRSIIADDMTGFGTMTADDDIMGFGENDYTEQESTC